MEIARLRSLFAHAFLVLGISLLAIALLSDGVDLTTSVFWSSVAGALGQTPTMAYFVRLAYTFALDREATTGWWGFTVVVTSTNLSLLLYLASILQGGRLALLVGALAVQLLFGLWVFTRLMVHRY
jgi:hypothetical protein